MESCESPVASETDCGLGSFATSQQQHHPWNNHPYKQVPPCNQHPSLESLSLAAPHLAQLQSPKTPCEIVRKQQQQTQSTAYSDSSSTGQLHTKIKGLKKDEKEEVNCGHKDKDLDEMEIDSCVQSLQSFCGVPVVPSEGTVPVVIRQQPSKSGSEEGEEEEESSDVENLVGEIVYQSDGSAYIVESLSQLIESDGSTEPGLLPPDFLPREEKSEEPAGTSLVNPQIINTFHIASSFGKWFESFDQGFPNSTTSLAGLSPGLHSFHVFDVQHKSNKDYLNNDGSAKKSCISRDVANKGDISKFDSLALYGKGKPILMCFLCKLSFGYARSFITHAVNDHRMTLCKDERKLLGHKYVSAIIQGIGKDKEPLISFLEPKIRNYSSLPSLVPVNSGLNGTYRGAYLEVGGNSDEGKSLFNKKFDMEIQQQALLTLSSIGSHKTPSLTSTSGLAKDSCTLFKPQGRSEGSVGKEGIYRGEDKTLLPDEEIASEEEEELVLEEKGKEVEDEGTTVACSGSSSSGDEFVGEQDVSNQGISKSLLLMPSSALQPSACLSGASSALNSKVLDSMSSSTIHVSQEGMTADGGEKTSELLLSFNCQGATVPLAMVAVTNKGDKEDGAVCSSTRTPSSLASSSIAEENTTALEPNKCLAEENEDNCASFNQHYHHNDHHPHLSESEMSGMGECAQNHVAGGSGGSGVECSKCETILGSSRSLGGHMTMMHSRNSCKTLKCPKCNWHYKYQQTLEAHIKEKHPDSEDTCVYCSKGQNHPRLARGESYNCGYKPFRCEVCNYSTTTKGNLSIHMQSDKHLNNIQTLQNGGSVSAVGEQVLGHAPSGVVPVSSVTQASSHHLGHHHHPAESSTHMTGSCSALSPTNSKSKPNWRCEVCDYETNVARNLRIHMTSEKHMHNMMLLQVNRTQMQHSRSGLGPMPSPSPELYQYYLMQNMSLPPGLKVDPPGDDVQFLLGGFHLDLDMTARFGGDIAMDVCLGGGQLGSEELMTLGESLSQTSDPSLKLFQCAVCNCFTTDNLDMLGLHMDTERSLPEEEWKAVVGDSHQCKLCHYTTQLKANFHLHCKTEKHVQKYQLVAHIKEGGNEWRLKCVAIGNPVHLKCNACNYYTSSLEKLRMHTLNSCHEASLKLYKHLQQHENAVENESYFYHCVLCNYSTKAKLNLIQHVRSMKHQSGESLRKLQHLQKGLPEEEVELSAIFTIRKCPSGNTGKLNEDVEAASDNTTDQEEQTKGRDSGGERELTKGKVSNQPKTEQTNSPVHSKQPSSRSKASQKTLLSKRPKTSEKKSEEQVYQCPYCKFSDTELNRLRMHIMTQHSVQPMFRCPLCQDKLNSKIHLQFHLTNLHSVAPACVEKLIDTVSVSDALPASIFIPVPGLDRDAHDTLQSMANSSSENTKVQTDVADVESEKDLSIGRDVAEDHQSPFEEQQPSKDDSAGCLCWVKDCNKVFKSSNALQMHFNENHNKTPQLPVSSCHVYKYHCNQCSLAFRTTEKLQLHSQCHAIHAPTMCCLCQCSFKSWQALKKHVETSHQELSEADIQQLYGGLLKNGDSMIMGGPSLGENQGSLLDKNEGEESDPEEQQSSSGSDSGYLQEDSRSEPKQALPFKNGPNDTIEKFLDPSRPFKCKVCKESFTQKNILLVHYNSVSHLHKVKRSLQESTTVQPEPTSSPHNKPYKCNTCNVEYSQSSTLEIHMRSVLHQTRAAKIKAANGSSTSVSRSGSSGSTSNSSSIPNPIKATNLVSSSSSSPAGIWIAQNILGSNHPSHSSNVENLGKSACPSSLSENHDVKKNNFADILSSRAHQQQLQQLQQQLVQAQVHVQAQLQQELQQAILFQSSQYFNPLLQHFPMAMESLLPLEQQQLLFPFYIPGTEFQLNAEMNLSSSSLNLSKSDASLLKVEKNSAQKAQKSCLQQQLIHHQLQQSDQSHSHSQGSSQIALLQGEKEHSAEAKKPKTSSNSDKAKEQEDKEIIDKTEDHAAIDNSDNSMSKENKDAPQAVVNVTSDSVFTPPRIASDNCGNATKALLENFGFELVIQYNENKQKAQKKMTGSISESSGPDGISRMFNPIEGLEKLECESCGKLFSNILILKSHQEHIHQALFPFRFLERFAKEYRNKYDQLYPLGPQTLETFFSPETPVSTSPPPPPSPPPQRVQTPNIPLTTTTLTALTSTAPQPPVPLAQVSMSMDLPLFSPFMMQSVSLQSDDTSQISVQLPAEEPSPATDLHRLYQHQLTPAMLQKQEKSPRTCISDNQLRVLRQYFNINNSPNEKQIKELMDKLGLPQKVIKHWFRNTLFKGRQSNKDSGYNFNNPPITTLEDIKIGSNSPSPKPQKQESYGNKRSSRTRFTDYQMRLLQDFFDTNAYPKDDEFEQLSNLLSLPTRVIVVWFQNARQKARKNYENLGDGGKAGDQHELSSDRYIRTTNLNYQCKKCSLVFLCIFDLIKHQKKLCYKDEEEDGQYDSHEDSVDLSHEYCTPSGSSGQTTMPSSSNLCPLSHSFSHNALFEENMPTHANTLNVFEKKSKHYSEASLSENEQTSLKQENSHPSEAPQQRPQSKEKTNAVSKNFKLSSPSLSQPEQHVLSVSQTSQSSQSCHMGFNPHLASALQTLDHQMTPYHCEQCKIAFPSFEHWLEHQQLHFLSVQNQFIHSQFSDNPIDMSFMLCDPSNSLLTTQLQAGAIPQMSSNSATSPLTPTSTMNSLKRKLEKTKTSPGESDSINSGEEPQRDKRLRTTITPEQLEILYQKYLLDSNPTRKMLDHIAHEVGLKKRVVQVWFQNTRARERKGQFRAVEPAQTHHRCPFCQALFKAKTALEAHIRSCHWHEAKHAGYNLTLSSMLPERKAMQLKRDPLDIPRYSNLALSNNVAQYMSMSPVIKNIDLTPWTLLSPTSIKVERVEDFESQTMSSKNTNFNKNKLDTDDCSSVNTAITDTTKADEANIDNESADTKHSCDSGDFLKSVGAFPSIDNDEQISSGLVSPTTSYYTKDFENENMVEYSETSSLADPCSPCPGDFGSRNIESGERPGQRRFRTQMTNLQLKVLKSCFNDYRTPTMLECGILGNDIGLPKRVVQVWFQNARAKEKKAMLSMAKHYGINMTSYEGPKTECTLCDIKYSSNLSVRDHIFSQQHISKVKDSIGRQLDKKKEYFDPALVQQIMAQQEIDRIKKANDILGLAQQQDMQFDTPALQALNLQSGYPNVQGITPVLLSDVGGPSIPGFNLSSSALALPKPPNFLNMSGANVPSTSLSAYGLLNKTPSSSSLALSSPTQASMSVAHVSPSLTFTSKYLTTHPGPCIEPPKDCETERARDKEKPKGKTGKPPTSPTTEETPATSTSAASFKIKKTDIAVPATSLPIPGMEFVLNSAQLQALQAALASDPTALLTNQFFPYFMQGISPYYYPQIPCALQGGYLQPMYGMESLFFHNPALSQALKGLSPGSFLQHYQQYQQSLLEALQQQQRQLQQLKTNQTVVTSQNLDCKDPAKDPVKKDEQKRTSLAETSSTHKNLATEQHKVNSKGPDPLFDQYIVPKVQYQLGCRKCQAVFSKEEAAISHLKSICFFGQSEANLQEMLLQVPISGNTAEGGLYDCLACDTTLEGDKALSQHLDSALHKHRTINKSRNAKEVSTSLIPHSSAWLPSSNTLTTSESASYSNNTSPPPSTTSATTQSLPMSASSHTSTLMVMPVASNAQLQTTAACKPCLQHLFPTQSSFPPISSLSTVTSSSLSTSGVQTLIPRDVFMDEFDSDSSQKSADKLGRPAEEPQQPVCRKDSSSCSSNLGSVGLDSISFQ